MSEAWGRIQPAVTTLCRLLWTLTGSQPEVQELMQRRLVDDFTHYMVSRAGLLQDSEWTKALYILPPSLVNHLRQRGLALDPPTYVQEAIGAAGQAVRRLQASPVPPVLTDLARSIESRGLIARAFAGLGTLGETHADAIVAAMVLRETRAAGHYLAATGAGLEPPELLELSSAVAGRPMQGSPGFFKWRPEQIDQARLDLQGRGLLGADSEPLPAGRELRRQIEARTGELADQSISRWLAGHSVSELEPLRQYAETLA